MSPAPRPLAGQTAFVSGSTAGIGLAIAQALLAVTSPTRAKALPDVPTVAESGYPGFAVETWFGLVAPAATPAAVVQKLHDAWAKGAKTAEAQAAFDNISGNLRVTTPQEFDAFIKAENNRWGALIRKLDIKAN